MNCRVCGRQFDPTGFQVMVPGLPYGFDRVDCALEAGALGPPPARGEEPRPTAVRALPPPATVPALAGGPLVMSGLDESRPQLLVGANLALLAAGAAATIYLWLHVFGANAGPLAFPAGASPAFERTAVAATIDLSPAPGARPLPESAVRGGGSQLAAPAPAPSASASEADGRGTLVSERTRAKHRSHPRRSSGPVARPSAPPPAPEAPADPTPARSAPVPTVPIPASPPGDRVPGPTLPGGGGGSHPGQPTLPGSGGGTRG